ncbi:hypothetical protein OG535_31505 [Kitasatospora sp. NBC_00085]|uniref:hypothetical protein n=1 Tax=unclassified Kitasatospora TaxID=2633591 RepID=UPI00324C56DD
MERHVDVDAAAEESAARVDRWRAAGLVVRPVTWRDGLARWPQPLETDRARVADPDSVGIHLSGPAETELLVVLFRGGWADVDHLSGGEVGAIPAQGITSARVFGGLLDGWVWQVLGVRP